MTNGDTLLRVRNLRTWFNTEDGLVKAVDGVSFRVPRGKTYAIVGESGCGKSVTAFSILQLLSMPPALITSRSFLASPRGQRMALAPDVRQAPSTIEFEGRDLLELSDSQMREVRGGRISMIFQEPMSSLNPVFTCGSQITEAICLHRRVSQREARELGVDLLRKVGIPEPAQRFDEYPHQLSGGMRQRVMIAMALSCNPRLLIADEPTTALDVTIQAQILDLLKQIQARENLSIMLITHDLAVVAEVADMVAVMYASKIVELTDVKTLFSQPLHPYTQGLFRSVPRLGQKQNRLQTLGGSVPNPLHFPIGCKFHPRCTSCRPNSPCRTQEPALREVRKGHWVACWDAAGYESAPVTDPSEGDAV